MSNNKRSATGTNNKSHDFIKEVAKYFMDFLETDFHKRRTPKRSVQTRNKDNLLVGLNLNKYPDFQKVIRKKFSKGFHLEGKGYSCAICRDSCSEEETWYDQYGLKCMNCQACVDRGDIPAYCAENRDKWYCRWDMESDFNVKRHTLTRWIKEGILKARIIERERFKSVLYKYRCVL